MTRLAIRRPRLTIAIWALIALVATVVAAGAQERFVNEDFAVPGGEAERALGAEAARFGGAEDLTLVLLGPDAQLERAAPRVAAALAGVDGLRFAAPPRSGGAASPLRLPGRAIYPLKAAADYRSVGDDVAPLLAARVRAELPAGVQARVTGLPVLSHGIREADFDAAERAQLAALPVLLIVLLLTFRAPIAAALPILLGLVVIMVGTAILVLATAFARVEAVAGILVGMIGLALGVDYSLLLVARFREELRGPGSVAEAVERTMATAGRTIAQAGFLVVLGMAIAFALSTGIGLRSGSAAVLVAALVSVAAGRSLLPALLVRLGHRIDAWRFTRRGSRGWSAAIVGFGLRRPWLTLLGVGLPCVAFALTSFNLQTGPSDVRVLPDDDPVREGAELVATEVGPGWNAPFTLVVESDDAERTAAAVRGLERRAAATPGVAAVVGGGPMFVAGDGAAARLLVVPEPPADVLHLRDLRRRLLSLTAAGTTVAVSGRIAALQEFNERTAGRRASSIALLALLMIPVLFVMLRSIVVPLKAAILNLLTIGVSFAVLDILFGGNSPPLGGPGWIDVFAFFGIFAVIYTLSLDYELFLVGRIQERYRRHRDSDAAVREGVTGTAAVVASAAAIMVSVFTAFAIFGSGIVQQFGAGLAVAIAFDATVVRLLLLPAAMSLLGDANWWLPQALRRRFAWGEG